MLKEKLFLLNGIILRWCNREVFRWLDLQVKNSVNDLNHLDKEMAKIGGDANLEIHWKRAEEINIIWRNLNLKDKLLRQKS